MIEDDFAIEFYRHFSIFNANVETTPIVRLPRPLDFFPSDQASGRKRIIRRSDVEFVAIFRQTLGLLPGAEKNATVGALGRFEFDRKFVIFVGVLVNEQTALSFVDDDRSILDSPVGIAGGLPAVQGFAVEQGRPFRVVSETGNTKETEEKNQGFHHSESEDSSVVGTSLGFRVR